MVNLTASGGVSGDQAVAALARWRVVSPSRGRVQEAFAEELGHGTRTNRAGQTPGGWVVTWRATASRPIASEVVPSGKGISGVVDNIRAARTEVASPVATK